MSSNTCIEAALPLHAKGDTFDGVHIVQPGEKSLVAYGLRKPREDGEQWLTIEVTRMGPKRHDTLSIGLNAKSACALRDALIRLYGRPSR